METKEQSNEENLAYNLFKDPALMAAKAQLTPEQQEAYKKAGEQMYNFDYGSGEQDIDKLLRESCNRVCHMLRHGLHPSYLEQDDVNIITEVIGEKWYSRFGYVKDDLERIVTVPKELPIPDS
jgi:hypothetical protein